LGVEELGRSEAVCKLWRGLIASIGWGALCQTLLGLPAEIDPAKYLPIAHSYKESLRLIYYRVFGVYGQYLDAKIGPIPPIPLKRWIEPDPCDPEKMVAENYELMYFPRDLIATVSGCSPWDRLDKQDNPDDPVAPRLIEREPYFEEIFAEVRALQANEGAPDPKVPRLIERQTSFREMFTRAFGIGANRESRVLRVPLTIKNVRTLFGKQKAGYLSQYNCIQNEVWDLHGDERIPAGFIWMRRDVIGRNLTFAQQQALAEENGVEIPLLLPRMLFNLFDNARMGWYPDGRHPVTFARSSTLIRDSGRDNGPSTCGGGGPSGLNIYGHGVNSDPRIGVAVALPAEAQGGGGL
jgi:hypothetical protein